MVKRYTRWLTPFYVLTDAGLAAGDKVVTAGTYALKARIMKSQLGEGHAH